MAASASSDPSDVSSGLGDATPGWRTFASLPDAVGYAGMFAGVLGGRLVAGGGSQFPLRPLWLGGEKVYTDRIFTLAAPDAPWEVSASRLPQPMAHFACAPTADSIYVAGGMDATGTLRRTAAIRGDGAGFVVEPLPDLPEPAAYAAVAVARGRLYVAGGQAAVGTKVASAAVWSLAVAPADGAEWRREPDLPAGLFVGAMAVLEGTVTFVGGVGFDAEGRSVQSRRLFQLDAVARRWVERAPMPEPRVGPLSPCPVLPDGRLWVVGGYATAFTGERRDHPGFSRQSYVYDPKAERWSEGPVLPHVRPVEKDATGDAGPAPMIAAAGTVWRDHVVIVGGEVRASVRTPAVLAWPLDRPLTR